MDRVERIAPAEPALAVRIDEDGDIDERCPWCGDVLDGDRACPRRCFLSRVNRVDDR